MDCALLSAPENPGLPHTRRIVYHRHRCNARIFLNKNPSAAETAEGKLLKERNYGEFIQ